MLDESAEGLSEDDRELIENVRQYGFHWFSVGQSEKDRANFPEWSKVPGWSYTIGLHASYGHPEIVVFELEDDITGALFWDLAESIKAGNRFEPGQIYDDVLHRSRDRGSRLSRCRPVGFPRCSASAAGSTRTRISRSPVPMAGPYGALRLGGRRRGDDSSGPASPGPTARGGRLGASQAQLNSLRSDRAGQKLGKSLGRAHPRLDAERARVRALWKLPGLDSNQQPSG
jgi:hypothetical protein